MRSVRPSAELSIGGKEENWNQGRLVKENMEEQVRNHMPKLSCRGAIADSRMWLLS
jgi:hypothetical protein